MDYVNETENGEKQVLPGSEKASFPCTLIHQALTPSPIDCEYFYTKEVGGRLHEFCGELELSTKKGVKGGSWSKRNSPPCYLCTKYTKKVGKENNYKSTDKEV
jgi:hypothetical protein